MPEPSTPRASDGLMTVLSRLLLSPTGVGLPDSSSAAVLLDINPEDFNALVALAKSNHVIVRGLEVFRGIMLGAQDGIRAEWAANALALERSRIDNAIGFLHAVCTAFEEDELDVTVIKTLDHWPDLGSDLDLYTNARSQAVCALMQRRFGAQIAARSWGDRLACKWNFTIPGSPESVEVHIGRLGQTGEQVEFASRLPGRARRVEIEGLVFPVPSASDRLMVSTLQRMYRHFYFRLCDVVDSAALAASGSIDYDELRSTAQSAGIWEGVATYLVIVSDWVRKSGGKELGLPKFVTDTAHFGGNLVYFSRDFLRVPILPQSAGLYRSLFTCLLRKRELHNAVRLGSLPWLATAAALGQKITGSDKGIW